MSKQQESDWTIYEKTGTCPWCGRQNQALYKLTTLVPLKTGSEDMTVVSECVCSGCYSDTRRTWRWEKRVQKEAAKSIREQINAEEKRESTN